MKIGNIKTEGQITWREWKKSYYEDNKEYTFGILRIWKPDKYPSYRLDMIELKSKVRVRRTLNQEYGKELEDMVKKLGADKVLRLEVRKNGDLEIVQVEAQGYAYEDKGKYYAVKKYEDAPF